MCPKQISPPSSLPKAGAEQIIILNNKEEGSEYLLSVYLTRVFCWIL